VPSVVPGPVSHTLVRALRAVPAFAELDETTLCSIVGASSNFVWRAGTPIFAPGDPAEALYVVLSGAIRIADDPDREVARLGPGDFFGELSLLLQTSHTKRAEVLEDSELMVLPKESFEELLDAEPGLADAVHAAMAERRRSLER
jgi:CRP/FNR family cyclic AMP-dependent transcriptional regulator